MHSIWFPEGDFVKRDITLVLAIVMTGIFTIALFSASTYLIFYINWYLLEIFPDYGISESEIGQAFLNSVWPLGIVMLVVTFTLIIVGFIVKKGWLSATGSIAFYLPVFGSFSLTMFYLAGIGILRVPWIPLIEVTPVVFELGHVVLLPNFTLTEIYWADIIDGITFRFIANVIHYGFTIIGIAIFAIGTTSWFLARFRNQMVVDFGIYKYSRHPQYLGFLLWSYGILLATDYLPYAYGGLNLSPSLPWLLGLIIVLAVAVQEEIWMAEKVGEEYMNYRDTVPFFLPLPRRISNILKTPFRLIFKKNWPERRREIAVAGILYLVFLILLSVPIALHYGVYF